MVGGMTFAGMDFAGTNFVTSEFSFPTGDAGVIEFPRSGRTAGLGEGTLDKMRTGGFSSTAGGIISRSRSGRIGE